MDITELQVISCYGITPGRLIPPLEAHGGRLWPVANGDYGATFHFTLPIDNGNQHD